LVLLLHSAALLYGSYIQKRLSQTQAKVVETHNNIIMHINDIRIIQEAHRRLLIKLLKKSITDQGYCL
jgi:hypothetical protein